MDIEKKKKTPSFEGEPTLGEKLHFERIAREISAHPRQSSSSTSPWDESTPMIGMLREKRLHAIIKRYLCEDLCTHEIPVRDLFPYEDDPAKNTNMVADVLVGKHIYEVQTGSFYPLRKKLHWYLEHTDCHVTVVHPMAGIKYMSWIDPTDGCVIKRNKCNKRGRIKDVARELYWLSDLILQPRFSLRLLLVEMEEYRLLDGYGKDRKIRASKYERFPTTLLGDVCLCEPEDYAFYFLPESLGTSIFTAAEYIKASGIRGKAAYSTLHLLTKLGILEEGEKRGRSMTFHKKD